MVKDMDQREYLEFISRLLWQEEKQTTEYSWVFEGTCYGVDIPLWESAYCGETDVLLNQTTLAVQEVYYEKGVCPVDLHMPADYIGYETEFMRWLFVTEPEGKTIRRFYQEHYRGLLTGVFRKIAENKVSRKYSENARYILENIEILDSLLCNKGEGRNDKGSLLVKVPDSRMESNQGGKMPPQYFRYVDKTWIAERMRKHTIPTSGRGNCGGKCELIACESAGCITHLEAGIRERDALTIRPCVKGRGYRQTFLSSRRLRYPMVRVGERGEGKFRRISWEQALDLMEEKLKTITEQYGVGSRYVHYSSGVAARIRGDEMAKRLLALTGGYLDYYNTYSSACITIAAPYTYGSSKTGSSTLSFKKSEYLILWGHNPVVTSYESGIYETLIYHKNKGTKIVVIDPQYSDTAAVFGTKWLKIRPGTDGALATAMAYVIWTEELYDKAFMDMYCLGFDREHMPEGAEEGESYEDYLLGNIDGLRKTPEWASEITGIPADEIYTLAREYATAKPAGIVNGLSMQRQANGEQSSRSIMVLPCLTGNVGIEGGGTGSEIGIREHAAPKMPMPENPYHRSIPVFLWTDAILHGRNMTREKDHIRGEETLDSDIKFIFNLAGNSLVNQHSDINRTDQILKDTTKCEFIVVSDLFMTPSARYADLLLPGTSLFEGDSMAAPWGTGDFLLYGNQVVEPLFESKFEFEWLSELAKRFGVEDFSEGCQSVREWNRLIYDRVKEKEAELPKFETFAANGGYRYREPKIHVAFKEQREDFRNHPFPTESGKIEIYSKKLEKFHNETEIPPIPKYIPAFEGVEDRKIREYPLQLIGWHTKRRCHSIHDNNPWMEEIEPHRMWINPLDAKKRGIKESDVVVIYNDRGEVRMQAHVSERIMAGVICIPQGAWHQPDSDGVDIRGSVNTLTIARPTPLAKGNPQHSCLVEVKKGREITDENHTS